MVVAYTKVGTDPDLLPLFRLVRERPDTSWEELDDLPQRATEEVFGAGPVIVNFEDGFAVEWTSVPVESPLAMAWPRVMARTGKTLANEAMWVGDAVQGMTLSNSIALGSGGVDRRLHMAWTQSLQALSTIERQLLVVQMFYAGSVPQLGGSQNRGRSARCPCDGRRSPRPAVASHCINSSPQARIRD